MSAIVAFVLRPRSTGRAISRQALIGTAVPALLLALAAGWIGHGWLVDIRAPRAFEGFQQVRLKTIQTQLDQVEGPYIMVLGDSHAERLYLPSLCGLPVVNAGVSGATVSDVLDLARKITPPRKAQAVLLSVGTNDIGAKRNPQSAEAESGFRTTLVALKQRLASWSGRRALIAIPPVASKEEALFPRAAATRYSAMLAQSCEPKGCLYLDLFAGVAQIPEPRAAFSDGVHLRNYARFVRDRETEICSGLGIPALP
jgi:lysophospholipase L1-like esterase